MKGITASMNKGINIGAMVNAADNSGARIVRVVSVIRGKGTKRRQMKAGVADMVKVSVRKGLPEMRKHVFPAIVIRQKKEYRRLTGERISFADNAVVLLKDEKILQNPRGTQIKGPVAKEVKERWSEVAKMASIVV